MRRTQFADDKKGDWRVVLLTPGGSPYVSKADGELMVKPFALRDLRIELRATLHETE